MMEMGKRLTSLTDIGEFQKSTADSYKLAVVESKHKSCHIQS